MNIPMPTPEEKRRSIEYIKSSCNANKKSIFSVGRDIFQSFGLRNLFFGITDCVYITLICSVCTFAAWIAVDLEHTYTVLFIISPFFYVLAYLLSLFKEQIFGTLPVQRACKYTPAYLTSFRMLAFSLLSILIDIPATALCSAVTSSSLPRMLLISFCSLFTYSVLMIAVITYSKRAWASFALPVLWTAALLIFLVPNEIGAPDLLEGVSPWFFAAIGSASLIIYLLELNTFIKRGEKEIC